MVDIMKRRLGAVMLIGATLLIYGCAAPREVPEPRGTQRIQPFTVRRVEIPYRTCNKPQRVGESVYMVVGDSSSEPGSIVEFDMQDGTQKTVVESRDPESIGWFVVNEKWLVWSEGASLFAQPREGGERITLSTSRDLYAPALSGDRVAWDDLDSERNHRIVVRDLTSSETTAVAPLNLADLYNNFPAWDGDRLLWTDVIDGDGIYRVFDSSTGDIRDYPQTQGAFRFPGYAQPSSDRFYSITFDNVDEWNWGTQRFGYFSISEQQFVPLVADGTVVNSFAVGGGLAAIIDSDQRLSVLDEDQPQSRAYYPVKGRVDFVQASPDGSLIAWREGNTASTRCQLFVIESR